MRPFPKQSRGRWVWPPTGDTVITGPSSSADPSAVDADIPIIVVDADMDGYELPGE